ncbi:MAG TPA: hypothetical protein VK440_03950 [Burkholderiales bacterium]|nr:hypothetical protein [Burkholderiales bacterium]HYA21066.1 hypothetical protein [Burkholderiales bacterium]
MIRNRKIRRAVAAVFLVLGALLMWFAPEVWWGLLLLAVAIALELIGIALEHAAKTG